MKCKKCGSPLADGVKFCEECGAPVSEKAKKPNSDISGNTASKSKKDKNKEPQGKPMLSVGEKISDNIYLCRDGAYRWVYEYNLYKRPGIFFLVWKILFCIITAGIVIAMISDAARWSDFFPDRFLTNLKFYAYFVIGMTVLSLISYLIYAMVMGGKYCIIFEMDEKGINHKQMPQQAKKAEMLAKITMMAGLASGSLTTLGVGASAARTEMYSEFSKVKAVKSYPRRHLIKVNGILSHNQVYADKNDFEFVQKYILDHCKNLKTTTTEK